MNSLLELNTYSNTQLSYTDLRTAKITFDRLTPVNQTTSYAEGQSHIVPIGLNILDIVLPSVEKVNFLIDVSLTSGASVSFLDLPDGYTVDNYGPGFYKINNIQSPDDWNRIKYARVNVASGQDANFSYTCTIQYEDIKSKSWTVLAQITQAAALTATVSLSATGKFTEKQGFGNLLVNSTISCSAEVRKIISLFSTADLSLTPTKVPGYVTGIVNTTYIANKGNALFATNVPRITDDSPAGATFRVTFSSPHGRFGDSTSSGTSFSYSGTFEQVNAYFSNIYFWPTKDYQSNTTYTYVQQKNGSTQISKTVTLTYASTNTAGSTYTFNTSGTWTPNFEEVTYCNLDVLVVGGGGGGVTGYAAGAGGGGGAVGEVLNLALSNVTYQITVGSGGASNPNIWDVYTNGYTFDAQASPGTLSRIRTPNGTTLEVIAQGGSGARFKITNNSTNDITNNYVQAGNAGASWSKKVNSVLTTYTLTQTTHKTLVNPVGSPLNYAYGGNGQGSSASSVPIVLSNAYGISTNYGGNGGAGVLSTITGQYYGGGGGGAFRNELNSLSGQGGLGGGGNASINGPIELSDFAQNGSPNTGGGGGGNVSVTSSVPPGDGASGIVIIRTHP